MKNNNDISGILLFVLIIIILPVYIMYLIFRGLITLAKNNNKEPSLTRTSNKNYEEEITIDEIIEYEKKYLMMKKSFKTKKSVFVRNNPSEG